ncbi:BA75_02743T0 [Komagataella pastoris]|uniref:Transcription initiation factor TFIID subunit 8 n=1 Tax=Komagataella pastoris TaxID=4922 RepID=A0A1B2JC60_PICPA|nr:BA75_02743T0 [Komagataella pastoris]
MADKSDDNQSLVLENSASNGKENDKFVGRANTDQSLSQEEQHDQKVQERYNTDKDLNISSQPECVPAMAVALKASVLLILSSLGVQASSLSVDHLTHITTKYIDRLVSELHRSTEIQRRRTIAKRDIQLVVDRGILDLEDVTLEYERLKLTKKRVRPAIEKLSKYASELKERSSSVQVSENDKDAFFFFDIAEKISEFMPLRMKRKNYIPKWMPVLPPEHTYVASPQFTKVISDPKELREQLTAESRLGEKALQHLIGTKIVENKDEAVHENDNDIDKENDHSEVGVESDHNLEEGQNEKTNGVQLPPLENTASSKRFDIVAHAKHRMSILEKRRRHQEQLLENRRKEIDGLVGQYLGYYATKKIEPPVSDIIVNIMNTEYYHVSREVSKSEQRKQKIQESQQLKRRKLEDELQQELEHQTEDIDFEFNFDEDDVDMNNNLNENQGDEEQVPKEKDASYGITNGDTEKDNQETTFTNGSSKQWNNTDAILDSTNSEPETEPPMADLFNVDGSQL